MIFISFFFANRFVVACQLLYVKSGLLLATEISNTNFFFRNSIENHFAETLLSEKKLNEFLYDLFPDNGIFDVVFGLLHKENIGVGFVKKKSFGNRKYKNYITSRNHT